MKILHINSNFLYTTLFEKMIESFNKSEHEVFSPISGLTKFTIHPKEYVHYPVAFTKWDRFRYRKKQLKIMTALNSVTNVSKFNIVHAHTLFTDGNVAYELKKQYGIPYIVAVRNTDVNMFFKYRINLRKLGIDILVNAEKIVFLSQSYLDEVITKYTPKYLQQQILKKCSVIPNGIDHYWFENKNSIKCQSILQNELNIVYAGKINKNKNIINSINAIKLLQEKGLKVNFNIAGEIQDESILAKMNQYNFVNYKGIMKKEELIELYRSNDIFLMPSFYETFGLVYAEAMSQGLPVIYTKGQGFDQQFPEGLVGYHVNASNPEDIMKKIELINSELKTISENALNAVDAFKWNNIGETYENIYSNIYNVKD